MCLEVRATAASRAFQAVVNPLRENGGVRVVGERYVIDGRLGEGGMGCVYRARHVQLGKTFALKVLSPAFANDAELRERFNFEARLASGISHPNIVSIVDYGEDAEVGAFMVMELVDGEPLLFADDAAPLSIRRALDVLGQVADALVYIHRRGIVHGDISADNIMLAAEPSGDGARRRRVARLLDFGLARRLDLVDDRNISGTPHYLAPERARGGPATVATDLYALGVLGFLLFTRTLPFGGDVLAILDAHVERNPPTLAERRGAPIDPAIETLIARAMAKDPRMRHPTAAAFRYELNTVLDMLGMGRRRARSSSRRSPRPELDDVAARSPFAQVVVTVDGSIELANRAFAQLVGIAASELAGMSFVDLEVVRAIPELMDAIRRAHVEARGTELSGGELVVHVAPALAGDARVHVLLRPRTMW
jgi:serine/threonine protein kinase